MVSLTLHWLIGFPFGLIVENAGEWFTHRVILHGLGKNSRSFWSYHWYELHRTCRLHAMHHPGYRTWPRHWNTQGKEALFLVLIVLLHIPLAFYFPGYVGGMYFAMGCDYYKHRQAHLEPEWGKKHLQWHYRHHMGEHPDANWCVTWPWFDRLMNTRA